MEVIFEILLQLFVEVFFEGLFRLFAVPFDDRPHPVIATIAYALFGAILGHISVWLVPYGFIPTPELRLGYLIVAPLALGFAMLRLRAWFNRPSLVSNTQQFVMTAVFAFSFALVRYLMIY